MKKRAYKFASLLILITSLVLLVGGCGSKAEKEGGPVVLDMWIMPNSLAPVGDLNAVLEEFHKQNPNIRVKVTSLDWGAAWTKITTAAASGDVPDIVQLGTTWVGSISAMNVLSDLTDKVNEIEGGKAAFVEAAHNTMGIEGTTKITAIPWFIDARALYFRTDVFKECGLTKADIATWEGFDSALRKIKNKQLIINGIKIEALGIPGKNDWNVVHNLAPWIWSAGGSFLTKDLKKSNLETDQVAKALDYYIGLVKKKYVPEECLEQNTAQIEGGFNNGVYAIIFTGSNELRGLTTPQRQGGVMESPVARNFDIAPYPEGPQGRVTFVGGSTLAIFKSSKKQSEAWKVLKYLVSIKPQVEYCKRSGFLPALKQGFSDPYISSDRRRMVYKEAVSYGKSYPSIPAWGTLEPVLTRRFGIMWDHVIANQDSFDIKDIRNTMQLADKEIDTLLKQE